jgi:hypothetical protein
MVLATLSLTTPFMALEFAAAALLSMIGAEGLHLFPLLGRQLVANSQQESRICLLQFGSGLGHLVNL